MSLVTKFSDHWDGVNKTKYPNHLVHANPASLKADEKAVLIRIDATGTIQRAWRGKVGNINAVNEQTYFTVSTTEELDPAKVQQYSGLKLGWHVLGSKDIVAEQAAQERYLPPLLSELRTTRNPFTFEDLVHDLIRLLGVHRSYRFPPDAQAGQADGFFKLSSLAVIYDATLSPTFEDKKSQQILNYCSQLLTGTVFVPPNAHEIVAHHQKCDMPDLARQPPRYSKRVLRVS